MIQHLAVYGNIYQGDKYGLNDQNSSAFWQQRYTNPIKNTIDLLANTKNDTGKVNLYNIARIFKAFQFQQMTDLYGDCPYSQAGNAYLTGTGYPVFDKQSDIYADMLNELSDAASKLDPSKANTLGGEDIIYGGDVTKWKKFAYSEMARLAMRMSKVDPANAQKWVQAAYAGGAIVDNADNAAVAHIAAVGNNATNNGMAYTIAGVDNPFALVSKTFVEYFKNHNDPRLRYYATRVQLNASGSIPQFGDPQYDPLGDTVASHQLGLPNGLDNVGSANPATDVSLVDPNYPGNVLLYSVPGRQVFANPGNPTFFLTAGETLLLFAEATQRGWLTTAGSDASLYNTAVEQEFSRLSQNGAAQMTDPVGQADSYLAANPYSSANGLQQINEQYWVATFFDEYEAWANWRRSDYPTLVPVNYPNPAVNKTNGTIPRRLEYPLAEDAINGANYTDAVGRLTGGDVMTARMWWDKN
jgi:hypothetical protein